LPNYGNNPDALQLVNGSRKCDIYIHNGVILSHKNNDMWFEGKWMQLEGIMLSEVSQAQRHKGLMFSLIHGTYIQKINIYTKTSMIVHKLICGTCL
jgi:hypothetical protein